MRYAYVVNEIGLNYFSVLDVGSGGQGICLFKSLLGKKHFFLLDVKRDVFTNFENGEINIIIGDGTRLPFRNKSFDVVISVDTIEHVPKDARIYFCEELKRVAKKES
ncbi:MAG: class I SAM-dependent methyltransferase [Nitrososphaeria archaeon]